MVCSFFQYILTAVNLAYNKNKLYKTLDCWSRDLLNFDFLEKSLGIVSPPYFEYYFLRKMFFMLYSINLQNFIVWRPCAFVEELIFHYLQYKKVRNLSS